MIRHWFPYTRLRREQNCTRFTAFTLALIQALGWIFLRLESPSWQALRAQHRRLYPHLADKPSTIDLWLRLAAHTPPAILTKVLAVFRAHPGSVSSANTLLARQEEWRVRRRYARAAPISFAMYCLRYLKRTRLLRQKPRTGA